MSRSKPKRKDLFQVSLMHVFRQSAFERDAKRQAEGDNSDDARALHKRQLERRLGANETDLRRHLSADMANLMNTINLESSLSYFDHKGNRRNDLEDFPYVRKSILNFGLDDMSGFSRTEIKSAAILRRVRECLINHEPRLVPETIQIKYRDQNENTNQKIAFDVAAEMVANPVDVPMEFVAEIDVGGGTVNLSQLTVHK